MPRFSSDPPVSPDGPALPIRRTPATGKIVAVVTSNDLIGCPTHYFGGHTVPCEAEDCKACAEGAPYRWHGYLTALDMTNRLHFLFEMTAQASDPLRNYREAHGALRGCLFQAIRLHRRPNGRVIIQCKPADLEHLHLPNAPDLKKVLAILWQLNLPRIRDAGTLKSSPALAVHQAVKDKQQERRADVAGSASSAASSSPPDPTPPDPTDAA